MIERPADIRKQAADAIARCNSPRLAKDLTVALQAYVWQPTAAKYDALYNTLSRVNIPRAA